MNRAELTAASEDFIRATLRKHLLTSVPVYLYGSRVRNTAQWNSDYDMWIAADTTSAIIAKARCKPFCSHCEIGSKVVNVPYSLQ